MHSLMDKINSMLAVDLAIKEGVKVALLKVTEVTIIGAGFENW